MSQNKELTPDAKYFDTRGGVYPAKRMFLGEDHQYTDGELCTLDGHEWTEKDVEAKKHPYLCVDFKNEDGTRRLKIPHCHLMVNFGRNNSRGDEAHKNFAYWRDVGLIRFGGNGFVPQGQTVTTMTNWIPCEWIWNEEKVIWLEKAKVEAENAKAEAASKAKAEIEKLALEKLAAEKAAADKKTK